MILILLSIFIQLYIKITLKKLKTIKIYSQKNTI